MADRPSRMLRNVQKASHVERTSTSKRQAMEYNRADLAGETDGKRESRRSKPEMAIYRPGMGLLQKKSDQSGTPDAKGQNLVPGLKDLSLKDGVNGKWSGNRAKRPDQPVYTPRLVKPSEDRPTALQEGRPKAVVVDSKGPQFSTKPVPVEGTKPASEKKTEISVQKLQQHLRPESALQNGHQEHRVENKVTETGAEHPKETAKAIEVIGPPAAKQQVVVGKRYSPVGNTAAPKHINQRSDRNFARYSRRGNGRRSGPFPDTRVEENWDISDSPGTLDKPQQGVSARIPGQPVRTTPSHRRNSFSEGPRHSGSDDVDEAEHGPRRRGMKKKIKKRRNKTREDQPVVNTAVNGLPENSHHSDGNATAEEDWSGELIVESSVHPRIYSQEQVSQNDGPKKRERNNSYQSSSPEPCRFSGLKFTNRHRRESRSEEEKDKSPTLSRNGLVPAPIIKDWSAAVVEEEKRQRHSLAKTVDNLRNNSSETSTYCSNVIEVHRKNCKNDSSSQKASPPKTHESQLPPRFQKRNRPATPENTVSSAAKGGIIRLPSDVSLNGSGPAEHQCDERSVVAATLCGMGQEKPLIAVKPQPHVPVDSIYSRTMPMTLQPVFAHHFEPAPPSVMSPPMVPAAYPAVPGVQFSCHHPNQGLPTVYHGDQVIAPEMYGQRQIKPLVQKNLHDAALLERELMNHLSKGIQNMDTKAMGHCRWKLQLRYENVILADPRFCAEKNVENALWKSAFYQGIEVFRRIMEECPDFQEEVKMLLLSLVDEGTIFYENLLDKFQETYGFSLSQFLEPDICGSLGAGSSTSSAGGVAGGRVIPDSVRLVLISVQKIYICLGDLARYREQAMGTTNYGKARSWYLKAQQIAPKNGRPYNQLAILALYARRKLDAVYYYMRSLAASNPFLTARESLLALFDDARKKYDHLERKRLEEEGVNQQPSLESPLEEERLEIWIRPDGTTSHRSSRQGDQASREVEQLSLLSTIDLNKRYVLSFLHVHGKLFTKVGMETFSETARRMLMEFRCLLQRTPAAVTNSRHLQLLAINMFTVANTCLKDRNMEPDCRSLLQEQSLQVALAHVAIVLERATQLLQQSVPSPSSSTSSSPGGSSSPSRLSLSDELAELLPTLKLWTDWMSCQKRLWIPPPTPCDYNTSVKGSVWTMLADLLTVLRKLNFGDVKFFKEPAEDRELVTLPEDTTLASFVPLLGAPQEAFYVQMPCDRERARNCLRINRIQFFGDYLCGISPPYLEFNVERKRFVSLISVSDTESDSEKELTYDSGYGEVENTGSTSACLTRLQSEEELELGDSLDDQDAPLKSEEEENEIQKLRTKKEELRKAKEQHDRQQSCVHAFLQEHRSKQAAMLEIRPRFLIPDTNCFIDHLPLVQKLVADGHFNVYVPIVVLNELHGLARGGSRGPGPFPDHCEKVGSSARAALAYLEERFGQREPKLRAITIRGSILDTISFRSEDVGDYKGTNDDQILTCCRLLCNDRTEHALPREPDRPVKLYRETVLITEDRNLCVKALTHNVPVRDLPAFLRWANIS